MRIGIVGAGVAGLTTAIALERGGHEPEIFERAPSARLSGGALLLWSNAMRVLERLGVARDVVDAGTVMRSTEFRSWKGDLLATLPITDLARRNGAPCVLVARARLLDVLTRTALCPKHYGKRLLRFSQNRGGVLADFLDGTSERFDVLVGADGLHSGVRAALQSDEPPRSARQTAWVGIVDVHHPLLDRGIAIGTVGRGTVMWAAGLADRSTYWYATVNDDEPVADRAALARRFRGSHEPIVHLIESTPKSAIVVTKVQDRKPRLPWSHDRVTLVGDAAHPCAPDLGQGACQAIESAEALAESLAAKLEDVELALEEYERRRFSRTARVTAASRATAMYSIVDDAAFGRIRNHGVRWFMPTLAPRMLDWLLGDSGNDFRPSTLAAGS